jgi:hypothetical protein
MLDLQWICLQVSDLFGSGAIVVGSHRTTVAHPVSARTRATVTITRIHVARTHMPHLPLPRWAHPAAAAARSRRPAWCRGTADGRGGGGGGP